MQVDDSEAARVLVVDDEQSIRRLLMRYLESAGFVVTEAQRGDEAIEVLQGGGIDLALVDVMLPGIDGFEVVRRARHFSDIPILLVTARGEETQRVVGLELGADDYVVKPFSAPEVVARVRAHLRRRQAAVHADELADGAGRDDGAGRGDGGDTTASSAARHLGRVEIDPATRRCLLDGVEVDLTRREFDLLMALAEQPGRVLTRGQLLEAAWGTTFVVEKTVDVHLASLRKKLGDSLQVTTIRGIGYRLDT